MHLLTGSPSADALDFLFVPQSIVAFGSLVIAEGCDNARSISWVHAWTVTDGIITQVKEYFNTSVTVTRLGSDTPRHGRHCQPVWESSLSNRGGKSVPGLVLAL
ncbi:hypothetical protein RND81_08G208200 [Saponaria officinalis]|uniref:Wound-induced protein 1 n=1 Tax=Saponaria officinalis TaxID=3572 RepID=A0AAW1JB54_SAPOF